MVTIAMVPNVLQAPSATIINVNLLIAARPLPPFSNAQAMHVLDTWVVPLQLVIQQQSDAAPSHPQTVNTGVTQYHAQVIANAWEDYAQAVNALQQTQLPQQTQRLTLQGPQLQTQQPPTQQPPTILKLPIELKTPQQQQVLDLLILVPLLVNIVMVLFVLLIVNVLVVNVIQLLRNPIAATPYQEIINAI